MKNEFRINVIYVQENRSSEIESSIATIEPPWKLSTFLDFLEENNDDDSQIIIPKGKYFVTVVRINGNKTEKEDPELENGDTLIIQRKKSTAIVIERNKKNG